MQKQQLAIIIVSLAVLLGLYFLGPTIAPDKKKVTPTEQPEEAEFDIEKYKEVVLGQIPPLQKAYLDSLEASKPAAAEGDENHTALHKLSAFWKDSIPDPTLHYFYEAKLAELDNTEKSLTFAAHSILGYLPFERNHEMQHYLANLGKQLFEKALSINATNDSTIVGLGGCLMYGAHTEDAAASMAGIVKVREVAERDSTNIFAQYMLGVGGVISKQFDRAAARFEKVVKAQPDNLEAMFKLAETYEMAGQKELAAGWYEKIMQKVDNTQLRMELAKRIETLRDKSPAAAQ
jgi:tetratricopeptide (TPR) repeat protein